MRTFKIDFISNDQIYNPVLSTKIMTTDSIISWQKDGEKVERVTYFIFSGSKITIVGDWSCEIKRCFLLGRKAMANLGSILKNRDHFTNKGPYNQIYGFSSSHVWLWELDHKEGWVPKKWCFQTVVLENTLESPLGNEEIKSVNPKGYQPEYSLEDRCWSSNTLATWYEEPVHWKRPWCWERLRAGEERSDRGWDSWMASPTQRTWVWANSRK